MNYESMNMMSWSNNNTGPKFIEEWCNRNNHRVVLTTNEKAHIIYHFYYPLTTIPNRYSLRVELTQPNTNLSLRLLPLHHDCYRDICWYNISLKITQPFATSLPFITGIINETLFCLLTKYHTTCMYCYMNWSVAIPSKWFYKLNLVASE